MGDKVKLPSSFLALPVIQEKLQDDICDFCEVHIIEGSRNTQFFQCDGRYCEQAIEMIQDDNEYIDYEFYYIPSKQVREMEDKLDMKIRQLANCMSLDYVYLYEASKNIFCK